MQFVDFLNNIDEAYEARRKYNIIRRKSGVEDSYHKSIFMKKKDLEKEAKRKLKSSPQGSPDRFMSQLETLESLHRAFEDGTLQKNFLSFYLL